MALSVDLPLMEKETAGGEDLKKKYEEPNMGRVGKFKESVYPCV